MCWGMWWCGVWCAWCDVERWWMCGSPSEVPTFRLMLRRLTDRHSVSVKGRDVWHCWGLWGPLRGSVRRKGSQPPTGVAQLVCTYSQEKQSYVSSCLARSRGLGFSIPRTGGSLHYCAKCNYVICGIVRVRLPGRVRSELQAMRLGVPAVLSSVFCVPPIVCTEVSCRYWHAL